MSRHPGISTQQATREGDGDDDSNEHQRPTRSTATQAIADLWWPFGPVVGRYTIKAAAEQTDGRLIQLVVRDSRGAATPLHIHHDADESFYVIDGAITVHVGDERFEAKRRRLRLRADGHPPRLRRHVGAASSCSSPSPEPAPTARSAPACTGSSARSGRPSRRTSSRRSLQMPDVAEFAAPDGGLRDGARRAAAGKLRSSAREGRSRRRARWAGQACHRARPPYSRPGD